MLILEKKEQAERVVGGEERAEGEERAQKKPAHQGHLTREEL
tara:strand:- start:49 stop:174 length:126 start_codon:yes stop_codon:yes gene_type:complete